MSVKAALKRAVGHMVSRELCEKLTEYAIAEQEPSVSLAAAETIIPDGTTWDEIIEEGKKRVWAPTFERVGTPDILYLEFGVWKGESIRHIAQSNASPNARFYGFDSFEGLPEAWRGMAEDRFDVGGQVPKIDDTRVRFVKGWFRDTLPPMLDALAREAEGRALVVHFDADLYSSTLFLLFALGQRFRRYHFIFDEFSGHETRALYNYMQATGAEASFFYRLDWDGWPQIVSGELRLP